jgi:transcriptional regulator with XRE-family HTH domain
MQHETPLGTLLRNRRQEARLSLSQLANLTGLHKSYLARIELGEVRQPSTENLQRIAAALELPEATVFGLLDERARDQLPPLALYLRAKYDLPDAVIDEVTNYVARYGDLGRGPRDGEDEEPDTH